MLRHSLKYMSVLFLSRQAFPAKIFVVLLCLSYCLNAAAADEGKLTDEDFVFHVRPLLDSIDVQSPASLYQSQVCLMLPVRGAFELGHQGAQTVILQSLSRVLDQTITLGNIRNIAAGGATNVDPFLLDASRSGKNQRRIFPTKDLMRVTPLSLSKAPTFTEARLCELQFCYLISHCLKNVCLAHPNSWEGMNAPERRFVQEASKFLLEDIVVPYWVEVEAWSWGKSFPNMRERVTARIDTFDKPNSGRPSYWAALTDEDLFLCAIAADLSCVLRILASSDKPFTVSALDAQILQEIRELTLKSIQQRLEPGEGFLYQVGVWSDHPDFFYADCKGTEYPAKTCPRKRVAEDSSHFHRWPWWLESFRDSWPPDHENHKFYETLLKRLANQFMHKVVVFSNERRLLLNNYMDGGNGWYRVGYLGRNWGYGPYTLSHTAGYGSWYILAKYDESVKKFNRALCSMIKSEDKEIVGHRVRFFGTQSASNAYRNGWNDQDVLGTGSLYDFYCRIAEDLGLAK